MPRLKPSGVNGPGSSLLADRDAGERFTLRVAIQRVVRANMVAPGCGALMIDLETGHLVDECLTGCALPVDTEDRGIIGMTAFAWRTLKFSIDHQHIGFIANAGDANHITVKVLACAVLIKNSVQMSKSMNFICIASDERLVSDFYSYKVQEQKS